MYKVLITTSGIGSRLGELTKSTNKSLIKVGDKTVISHIVENYPDNVELVITLGYHGNEVREFLQKNYPQKKFNFVNDTTWDKPNGGSLGRSMLETKDYLQCPFVFQCNDTIVKDPVPSPEKINWNGGSRGLDPEIYNVAHLSSFTVKNGFMEVMNRKGAEVWNLFHIGLVGFKDYRPFWEALEGLYNQNPLDKTLNDCAAMQVMIKNGIRFKAVEFPHWYDTGNISSLTHSRLILSGTSK